MLQPNTNISSKYCQKTRYNYVGNSGFVAQIAFFFVLRFCAIVSLVLHLPHKFLRKRYRKLTGFASRRDRLFLLRSEVLRFGFDDGVVKRGSYLAQCDNLLQPWTFQKLPSLTISPSNEKIIITLKKTKKTTHQAQKST